MDLTSLLSQDKNSALDSILMASGLLHDNSPLFGDDSSHTDSCIFQFEDDFSTLTSPLYSKPFQPISHKSTEGSTSLEGSPHISHLRYKGTPFIHKINTQFVFSDSLASPPLYSQSIPASPSCLQMIPSLLYPRSLQPCTSPISILHPKYRCPSNYCNKSFINESSLRSHFQCHSKLRTHVCEFCHAAFTRKHDLLRHMRTLHEEGRPFKCPKCMQGFTKATTYWRHLLEEQQGIKDPGQMITFQKLILSANVENDYALTLPLLV